MTVHTVGCTKALSKAVPTIKNNGKVKKWNLTVSYSYSGFNRDFDSEVDVEYLDKEPNEFTKVELLGFCNTVSWDAVFDSMYGSLTAPAIETKVNDFDITSLE